MRSLPLLLAALCVASAVGGAPRAAGQAIYPLDEVRPGLQATGLTVFAGETPDSFRVEVLGVLQRGEAGSHIILVRGLDERLARTGIAAGMSGSPLYAEGRLLGALAFAFIGATEPIGAATPIEEMLGELEPAGLGQGVAPQRRRGVVQRDPLAPFPAWRREWLGQAAAGDWPADVRQTGGDLPAGLQPIALPVFLDGELADAVAPSGSLWQGFGLAPMPLASLAQARRGEPGTGAGGAGRPSGAPGLSPGEAFGISLIEGDMVAAAIGTVTWREGAHLLGLGHPFMQISPAEFPITRARIHAVIPTRGVSFKVGSPLEEVGCLRRDGQPGIAAQLGASTSGIPLHVRIVPRPGGPARQYDFEVADHLILSPALMMLALQSVVTTETHALGPASLRTRIEVALADGRELAREDFFQTIGPGQTAANVLAPVAYLAASSLAPFSVRQVDVRIECLPELRALHIEQIRVPRPLVRAGERLKIEVLLRRHLGDREVRLVELAVPERLRGRRVRAMVGSAEAFFEWDRERAPQKYIPRDLDDLIALIEDYPSEENLIVRLYGPSRGIVLQGEELASLPLSKWHVLQGATSGGKAARVGGLILAEERLAMDAVVLGGQVVELDVED